MVRVELELGLEVGLGASLLLIAGCRCSIRRDQVPVADTGYTTYKIG